MQVKKVEAMFKTSDGEEFSDEKSAESHQKLIDVERQYDMAFRAYKQLLAETQKTADGFPFEFGVCRDYWYPTWWGERPRIIKISFIGREVVMHGDTLYVVPYQEHGQTVKQVQVSELYRTEKAAKIHLLRELITYQHELSEEMKGLQAYIKASA